MSKSLIISLVSIVIGVITIAVGLYVLSITPAPAPEQGMAEPADPFVVVPQVAPQDQTPTASDIPSTPAEPGSEPWCEQMMVKPDEQWNDADSRLFAQRCVYE